MRGLRQAYGDKISVSIAPGSYMGIFDVVADGKTIFSKKDDKAFPTLEDIKKRLAGRV